VELAEINKDTTGDITVTTRKPADAALSDEDPLPKGYRHFSRVMAFENAKYLKYSSYPQGVIINVL